MKKILAVNIDPINLSAISTLLMEHTPDFEILTSKKIGQVDAIVKKLSVDILVIDLESPSPQDLKLIGLVSKSYPKLPLLIMTAFETGEIESAIKSIGTARYFQKPVDFQKLVDAMWEKIERNVGGVIHGISLTSFLQMSEMEKTSCVLKINAAEKTGIIYLLKGALIAAETGELNNEEAVFDILSWENPTIELDNSPVSKKKEIEAPLISLLMESARRKDEGKKEKKKAAKAVAATAQKKIKKAAVEPDTESKTEAQPVSVEAETKPPEPEAVPPEIGELQAGGKISDATRILKRKQLISRVTKLSAAAVIILFVAVLWQFGVNPLLTRRALHHALADAKSAKSAQEAISILDTYLATGPKSAYAAQAQTLKQSYALKMETEEYEKTLQTVSQLPLDATFQEAAKTAYLEFLKQFPNSDYKDEINQRIQDIPAMMDDAEYTRLKNIPENRYSERLLAYQSYLTSHPDSANAASVREMMGSLGEAFFRHIKKEKAACDQEKNWQRCILLCQYYLDNCKENTRRDDIASLQRGMKAQAAYVKVAENVGKVDPSSEAAERMLAEYLNEYPDSPVKGTVEDQLSRINQKKNAEANWLQLVDYVKNERNDILDRINKMENYLRQQPSERHVSEAKGLYAWLLKEKEKKQQQVNQQAEMDKIRKQKEDFVAQERKKIIGLVQQSGGRYTVVREDTITDNQTGLTWCMFDSSLLSNNCINYKEAGKYVGSLTTGGYHDWRLPDSSELLVLYNSTPRFPLSDVKCYWTSEVFSAAWQEKTNTVVQKDSGVWEKKESDLNRCGAVRAVRP